MKETASNVHSLEELYVSFPSNNSEETIGIFMTFVFGQTCKYITRKMSVRFPLRYTAATHLLIGVAKVRLFPQAVDLPEHDPV